MPRTPQPDTGAEPLPPALTPLFQEYDFATLSWEEDRDLILGRVLVDGPWEAVRWLWRRVGDEGLREWIRARRGRALTPPQLRFWQLVLGLPGDEVDAWLEERGREPWERRWAE